MAAVSRAVATGRRMKRREGLAMSPRPRRGRVRPRIPHLGWTNVAAVGWTGGLASGGRPAMLAVAGTPHQLGEPLALIGREDRRHLSERVRAHLDALGHQPLDLILLG